MDNIEEWQSTVMKKIRYMTNNVWDGLNDSDVDRFLSNFDKDNKVVGWVMLDMLIYYSNEQEQAIISNLVRLLERDIWMQYIDNKELDSKGIKQKFQELYKKMCFVPVDESDPTASSFSISSQFRKIRELPHNVKFIDLIDLPLILAMKYEYVVFYDDLIGTGNQFRNFWEMDRFGKNKKISIKSLAKKNPNVKFYYIALGGCKDGMDFLKENVPEVKVIISEFFHNGMDIFSEENEYWELNPDRRDIVLKYIKSKESELNSTNEFTKNLPLLFQHGRASNTAMSLYWYNRNEKWKELYRR